MNTYEDEIYKFVATKENYKSAVEVAKLLPEIQSRLIADFWEEVKSKIDENNGSSKKKWETILDSESLSLKLYKNENIYIFFYFNEKKEAWNYGIGSDDYENGKYNKKKIAAYIKEHKLLENMFDNDWAIYWSYYGKEDSKIHLTQMKMLPNEREHFVNEVADFLFDFALENEEHILQFCSMRKQ